MAWSLLLAFVVASQILEHARTSSLVALPGCPDKCGNTTVPYPFGFEDGCFLQGFNLRCNDKQELYLGKNKVLDIDVSSNEVRVQNNVSVICGGNQTVESVFTTDPPFKVSDRNTFIAAGCSIMGSIQAWDQSGGSCESFCDFISMDNITECAGKGCCQVSIPFPLRYLKTSVAMLGIAATAQNVGPCNYAFVTEEGWFKYGDTRSTQFQELYGKNGVPLVLDWVVTEETCSGGAIASPSYACRAMNSECSERPNDPGYFCKCSPGYHGNPYLAGGCQDINECDIPFSCNGTCINTVGSYRCTNANHLQIGVTIGIGVGSAAGFIILVIVVVFIARRFKHMRAMKLKQKYFEQNRGQLLQQLVSQRADIAERMIITVDEIAKATNNFDPARKLGGGGHGTVYKGILSDLHVVAIKKSNITVQKEIDEFINEVAILSQINHRNVVKLFGCCLETEVPLLVYEFISNGTLYHHLHVVRSLSCSKMLRIVAEIANALAYLHSSVSIPIIHRDIKSSNILLDDTLTSKVSDFGASRYIPLDRTELTTAVQGTMGYLDPMCFYEGRLTAKSDVYSFGVLLVELLTRKRPSFSSSNGERLVAHFVNLHGEGNLDQILDPQFLDEGGNEVQEVAELAVSCVRLRPEDRPTMRQVDIALQGLLSSENHVKHNTSAEEFEDIGNMEMDIPSIDKGQNTGESGNWYSLEHDHPLMFSGSR